MRSLVPFVVSLALAGASVPVQAAPERRPLDPEAAEHRTKGLELYKVQDYEGAIREFQLGYSVDPHPDFLFAWAQAERLTGDCGKAIKLYERFIESEPPEQQVVAAQQSLDICREEVAAAPEPEPEPELEPEPEPEPELEDPVEPAPETVAPEKRDDGPRKWYRDPLGGAFLGLGIVGVGAGAGLLGAAGLQEKEAENAATYDEFDDAKDKARGRRIGGGVALGVGGALVVGAVIRYALVARSSNGSTALAPWFDGTSGGVALAGRF